jgi:TonB family protein
MKSKLSIIVLSAFFLFECKEEKKIEIIPDYNSIYLPADELTEVPKQIQGSENELEEQIKSYIKKHDKKEFENLKLDFKVFINESGIIEKIQIIKGSDSDINNIVLKNIETWKFSPAQKDGKKVKAQYSWHFFNGDEISFENQNEYLVAAEVMPEIVGGINAIMEKIKYPETAKQSGVQGKVFVLALIDEKGNVSGAKVIKGIGAGCDEAALNAVVAVKFTPALVQGKPVKVQVTVPIFFKLQ